MSNLIGGMIPDTMLGITGTHLLVWKILVGTWSLIRETA